MNGYWTTQPRITLTMMLIIILLVDIGLVSAATTLSFVYSKPTVLQTEAIQHLWTGVWLVASVVIPWLVSSIATRSG